MLGVVAAACAAAAPARIQAQTDSSAHPSAGTYTTEQAERGRGTFRQICAACHVVGQFSNEPFRRAWSGRPAVELFELIRTTMPQDSPGRLRRAEYADVLAYVMSLNGAPPGAAELPADTAALRRVAFPAALDPRN